MESLSRFINSKVNIGNEKLEVVLSNFELRSVPKGKFVLKKGTLAREYYFVKSGGLRLGYIHQDREITAWVALEGTFFGELVSLKGNSPTRYNIQTIEKSEILVIKAKKMEELYSKFPEWQEFGRLVWEDAIVGMTEGLVNFQSLSAEERYLSEMKSDFLKRIPLKELASYLGITPTSLSRLRKNIK